MSALGLLKVKVEMAVRGLGRSQGLPCSPVWKATSYPSLSKYGRVSAQALNKPPGEPSRALFGFLALTCLQSPAHDSSAPVLQRCYKLTTLAARECLPS